MTKVEGVAATQDVQLLREVFRASGAIGYRSVVTVSGLAHHGFHQGRIAFNERDAQVLVLTV